MSGANFSFLAKGHDSLFLQLAEAAECTLAVGPNTTLLKLRQLAETFAEHIAAAAGVWTGPQLKQVDLLRELDRKGYLDRQVLELFYSLRQAGNDAAHSSSQYDTPMQSNGTIGSSPGSPAATPARGLNSRTIRSCSGAS